ncbi:uncharacterized protein LOC136063568 [Quercus suber]|uniref:uncharacterized protein LOC136063568 n=1 Tax=Quercus suber TaxID=58331 RepID=UPI0032DF6DD9
MRRYPSNGGDSSCIYGRENPYGSSIWGINTRMNRFFLSSFVIENIYAPLLSSVTLSLAPPAQKVCPSSSSSFQFKKYVDTAEAMEKFIIDRRILGNVGLRYCEDGEWRIHRQEGEVDSGLCGHPEREVGMASIGMGRFKKYVDTAEAMEKFIIDRRILGNVGLRYCEDGEWRIHRQEGEVVLKKEIDVLQLRWYGYCMFRALLSLHKQGIVHRDVKPGNFLFSRKAHKGYLIDFNLAMDLHQKYGNTCKSRMGYDLSINRVMVQNAKSTPPTKGGKFPAAKTLQAVNQETTKVSKSTLEPKNLKKKGHVIKSQGADGSGITSVKDVTSTRTPSAERRREPMPCQGRKELISLLQETMQSPNHEASSVPAPMRKRVAATPGKVDSKLGYITPMPLHSSVIGVAGAGLTKKRGDGKHKREGPCVGTKGFRAPEVLFKSLHQGPKVDIWSAGVTLLYLMIGRMPFFGDPEQNIKEISKFRGSEDLWEVAKLHDRESSFPVELYDTQSLPSTKLRDWCETNTKRPEFLEVIPRSLFDLVDKCLTVNPRLRINAEEALKHEFFAPCHEALRKERLCRQGFSLDSRTSHS